MSDMIEQLATPALIVDRQRPDRNIEGMHVNHACATGAQHPLYHVVDGEGQEVLETWPRFTGW